MLKPDENPDELPDESKEDRVKDDTPKFETLLNQVFSGPMCFECLDEAENADEAEGKDVKRGLNP